MNRRSFLAAVAALPLVGRLVPKPKPRLQLIGTTTWYFPDDVHYRIVNTTNGTLTNGTLVKFDPKPMNALLRQWYRAQSLS